MSRRFIARSKLSSPQLNQPIDFFGWDVPAVKAARVLGISRRSAERVYQVIRQGLAWDCERYSPLRWGVEADESYFGGYRKGFRGRGAAGKVAVCRLLKRRGKVYTRPVPNVTRDTLRAVIRQKVPKGSTICSGQFSSYDGLITQGYRHDRKRQFKDEKRDKEEELLFLRISAWSHCSFRAYSVMDYRGPAASTPTQVRIGACSCARSVLSIL